MDMVRCSRDNHWVVDMAGNNRLGVVIISTNDRAEVTAKVRSGTSLV